MDKHVMVGSYAWSLRSANIQFSDIDIWYCGKKPKLVSLNSKFVSLDPKTDYVLDCKEMPLHILNYFHSTTPTLDELYTIKCSHLGWPNKMWDKHKQHLLMMSSSGAVIIPELYKLLTAYWQLKFGNKSFLNLNKNKKYFFDDQVHYVYNHDYLHLKVSYPKNPVYQSVLKKDSEVLICKNKFNALPFPLQVLMFQEEIHTIALERWILNPYWLKKDLTIAQSHFLALKKTITNLTKGWACDFIVQNIKQFNTPNYPTYHKVINKLLNTSQKEKYMPDKDTIELLDLAYKETKLNFPAFDLDLNQFILDCAEGDLYGKEVRNFLNYSHLAQEGGGEGGAEDCFGVFSLGDIIFKACYYYQSYDGHNCEDIQETVRQVKPVQKTVIVYL